MNPLFPCELVVDSEVAVVVVVVVDLKVMVVVVVVVDLKVVVVVVVVIELNAVMAVVVVVVSSSSSDSSLCLWELIVFKTSLI